MAAFGKIDLNAPKFRPRSKSVLSKALFEEFIKEHPEHSGIDYETFKNVVVTFNGKMREEVINSRDGIMLPESLGYIILVKCDKLENSIDFVNTAKYGKKVSFLNWDSDGYAAKIAYTNYPMKYRFANRQLWAFDPVKQFRSDVAKSFTSNYTKYLYLSRKDSLSTVFKKK